VFHRLQKSDELLECEPLRMEVKSGGGLKVGHPTTEQQM
jgi:hypothetical protein